MSTAREDLGIAVVDRVMALGLRVLPTWRHGAAPENWFYHHTLLAARDVVAKEPADRDPLTDSLVSEIAKGTQPPEPGYLAFVRALRLLPAQQSEAFLLHHCERLNPRYLGVAMDCSTAAAETHLRAADEAMASIAGHRLTEHRTALFAAYHRYHTPPVLVGSYVDRFVREFLRAKRRRTFRRRLLALGLLALLTCAAYVALRWGEAAWGGLREMLPRRASPRG